MLRKISVLAILLVAFAATGTAGAQNLNCADFESQADAQAELRSNPADPHGLDRDRDGIACEHLPGPTDYDPVPRDGEEGDAGTDTESETDPSGDDGQAVGMPESGGGGMQDQGSSSAWLFLAGLIAAGAGGLAMFARRGWSKRVCS